MSRATDAQYDLEHVVWPVLREVMGGDLVSVEADPAQLAVDLDVLAGIDFMIRRGQRLDTFAGRVQWRYYDRPAPWAKGKAPMSFTCRHPTEVNKRLATLDGGLSPEWTLQAYIERPGGPLESVGWIKTRPLYEYVGQEIAGHTAVTKLNPQDETRFVIVDWLAVGGYRYFRARPPQVQRRMF